MFFLQRSLFALSTTIRFRNEPMAKPLTSWLVASFSQHNLRLVVSERCLHVSVMRFWHKFASFWQVNTPSSWEKLLYRHVFDKISTEFRGILCVFVNFTDLPKFCSSATAQNIRSPVYDARLYLKSLNQLLPPQGGQQGGCKQLCANSGGSLGATHWDACW